MKIVYRLLFIKYPNQEFKREESKGSSTISKSRNDGYPFDPNETSMTLNNIVMY